MECTDQHAREDDKRGLATRPALHQSPHALRDEEHPGTGKQPNPPLLATVLPLGNHDRHAEGSEDRQRRGAVELSQDRRERR